MLGIPTHLAPRVNAWSLVRAFHAAALAALVALVAVLGLYGAVTGSPRVGLAVLALVPTTVMIAVHARIGTWRSAAAFLFVGGACSYWFTIVVASGLGAPTWIESYLLSLAVIPLVLVGGASTSTGRVIAWSILGFSVGHLATLIGTAQVIGQVVATLLAWVTMGLVVGIVGVATGLTARLQRVQPELLRSAREEHVSTYRQGIELEAAAILHDTVLNHLNAIALAPAGPMDATLARTVDEDFAMLTGHEWLAAPDAGRDADAQGRAVTDDDVVHRTVEECRSAGLQVDLTGDPGVTARLDQPVAAALARALAQCLTNVQKHAGTDRAEVSVFDDGLMCTVMVVDDGRGFDERTTGADRLGLRNSVRQRIDRVGGEVQVWSSPGSGTSVMMSVPFRPGRRGAAEGDARRAGAVSAPSFPAGDDGRLRSAS
ncbi:hypothetical protein DEI92_10990 [Curtobacterium sp. MCBD17_034]|uniref:sensor histidine kinase n=1 Tax=unclassified Curtobacterium TaxID=257496 RepID=UPI000DA77233|nr:MULTISPECIES: ATP-binding protein [unclassified Curtobacterium]PZF58577.1 hypothetical protein DEI92_10990 [Curtobacterium sp. MCBD17_034]PZM34567.1 hypothetical protein DEI90_07560 [Curtobacterium sp. MCBD17_031]